MLDGFATDYPCGHSGIRANRARRDGVYRFRHFGCQPGDESLYGGITRCAWIVKWRFHALVGVGLSGVLPDCPFSFRTMVRVSIECLGEYASFMVVIFRLLRCFSFTPLVYTTAI